MKKVITLLVVLAVVAWFFVLSKQIGDAYDNLRV